MRKSLHLAVVFFCSALVTNSYAQDTPVITPPMLETPQTSNNLIVPPFPPAAIQPPATAPATPRPNNAPVAAPTPTAQTPQAEQPAPTSSTAAPQPAASAGKAVSTTAFGEWSVECFDASAAKPNCQATHRVVAGDRSQVVMVFAIAATPEQTRIQIALPLGISLEAAAQLIVGNGYQNKIQIGRCTPQGCIIEGTVSADLLAAMRREKSGLVVVENEKGDKIELPFSLIGFTDAYATLLSR